MLNTKLIKSMFTIAALSSLLEGCATTRVVKTQPGQGGEIMVQDGIIGDARGDAKKKMNSNCGRKKPVVTEEGEAVIGSRSSKSTQLTNWGSSTSGESEQKTEWRIKYRCK